MRLVRQWIHWCRTGSGDKAEVLVMAGDVVGRLNPVAGWIWVRIEDAPGIDDLFRQMRKRYRGVADRVLRRDLEGLVRDWRRRGWILEQEDPVFLFGKDPWPV